MKKNDSHSSVLALSYSLVVLAEELVADGGIATVRSSMTMTLSSTSDRAKPHVVFLIVR
jgi:hypothetical protein